MPAGSNQWVDRAAEEAEKEKERERRQLQMKQRAPSVRLTSTFQGAWCPFPASQTC